MPIILFRTILAFSSFILAFIIQPACVFAVDAVISEEGYSFTTVNASVGGGFDFLSGGDIVGLRTTPAFDALELIRIDANGDNVPASPEVLHTINGFFFGTFVKVSPSGGTVLFAESIDNKIYRYDVSSGTVEELLTMPGIFDAAFIDEETVYLSTGSFTGEGDVWYWNWMEPGSPVHILTVTSGDAAAGAVAADDAGTLYYIRSSNAFPPPPGSHQVYRFRPEQIMEVLEGTHPVLGLADGELLAAFNTGFNIQVNAFGDTFVSLTGASGELGVFRIKKDGTTSPFLEFTNTTGSEFLSVLAMEDKHAFFNPFQSSSSRLAVLFDDFANPVIYILTPEPSDSFADAVIASNLQAPLNNAALTLGPPVGGGSFNPNNSSVVTLVDGAGMLAVQFHGSLKDNRQSLAGLDLIVFGNSFFNSGNPQNRFAEPAFVEVKADLNHNGNLADDNWFLLEPNPLPQSLSTPYSAQALRGYSDYTPTMILGDTNGDNVLDASDDPFASNPENFYTIPDRLSDAGDTASFQVDPGSGGGDALDLRWAVVQQSPGVPFLDGSGETRHVYLDRVDQIRVTDAKTGDVCVGLCTAEVDALAQAKNKVTGTVQTVSTVSEIQSTIDASSEGDVVKILPGTYQLTEPIVLKPGVSLEGPSGLWTVNFPGDDAVLDGTNLSGGEAAVLLNGPDPALSQDYSVSGLHFRNCPVGIEIHGLSASVEENFFKDCTAAMKLILTNSENILVRKNVFGHPTAAASVNGIEADGGRVAVVQNTFVNHVQAGLLSGGGAELYLRNNIFFGNTVGVEEESPSELFGHFNVFYANITDHLGAGILEDDILVDPLFAQAPVGDYRLMPDSAVRQQGLGGSDPGAYDGPNFVPCDIAALTDETAPPPPADFTAAYDGTGPTTSLNWADNTETDLAGYNVYRAMFDSENPAEPVYDKLNGNDLVQASEFIDSTVTAGINYLYYVTAVDTTDNESERSIVAEAGPAPPFVLDLSIVPLFNSGALFQSGAYVAKMLLDHMGSFHMVDEIYDYAKANNLSENSALQSVDPHGMRNALNHFDLPGYNFSVLTRTDPDQVLKDMAFWISRNIPGVPQPHVAGAVPAFGDYEHWLLVKGLVTSANPHESSEYEVLGFWFNDPNVNGIGANTFKTAEEFKATYLLPIQNNDTYQGKFLSVLEPPPVVGSEQEIKHYDSRLETASLSLSFGQAAYLASVAREETTVPASLIAAVQESAIHAVEEDYLPLDETFADKFAQLDVQIPYYVEDGASNYYLVPFGRNVGSAEAVVVLAGGSFHFKEISVYGTAAHYLPVSKVLAKRLVVAASPLANYFMSRSPVQVRLVRVPEESPFYPVWEVRVRNAVFRVYQDQRVEFVSGPYYFDPRMKLSSWFKRIFGVGRVE